MEDKYHYRLTAQQKNKIAQNLIDILETDIQITKEARRFIVDWILTSPEEKRKAFFDVWDIVLKKYLPKSRPVLFRSCERISKNGKIASFTGRLECARKFSEGKGSLIICDTKETLEFEDKLYSPGEYNNSFYPLVDVLVKAKKLGGWGFSESILNTFTGEDEYIMRIDLNLMYSVKWVKGKF